ncbi:MAG: phage major capsid protein [Burkholderiales bacterium]
MARFVQGKAWAQMHGREAALARIKAQPWIDREDVAAAVLKAGVSVSDIDDATTPGTNPISEDLVAALRPRTIFDRLGARQAPLHVRILTGETGADGGWVGTGRPALLSNIALQGEILAANTVMGLAALTVESLQDASPAGQQFVRDEVVNATAEALDRAMLDPDNAGSTDKPASITNGITPVASSGSSLSQIDGNLLTMADALIAAGSTMANAKWIFDTRSAYYLSQLRGTGGALAFPDVSVNGGTLHGLPVLTTTALPRSGSPETTIAILVDADDIVIADGGARVSVTTDGAIQASDAPTVYPNAPAVLSNIFQMDCAVVRGVRRCTWKTRRGLVAVLDDVTW